MGDQTTALSLSESLKSARGAQADTSGSASDTVAAMAQARDVGELERIRRAVEAAGEAAYHWTTASDKLLWNSNAASLLKIGDSSQLETGRGFADLLDPENATSRFDVVMRSRESDSGSGVPYCIEYRLRPQGRQSSSSIWVEDSGRWYAGKDGKPAEAFGVIRPIDDRHERDQRLEFLSNCDPLTGMMNRGRMADKLAGAIAQSEMSGVGCGFLIAIINNLAVVNDAYGFDIADEVIVSVGQRLGRVVRQDDHIARYSGAKYAILLTECTQDELQLAAERFLRVARDSVIETELGPVWAMLSIGGVFLPKHADSANAAMAAAEEALAEAKRQTSDCFVAFEPSEERISVRDLNARCAAEIVSGLREDRFALAFQPIVKADGGAAVMHEALLRMKCSEDGDIVAASHLIPIAEKLGLVRLIDQTVVKLAIQTLTNFEEAQMCINVSGTTSADPRWYIQLAEELSEHPDVAARLIVEITESAVLKDLDEAAVFVNRLRELGCKVAIDDFGAGYTSFRNLKALNVDMVKIDGMFCEDLSHNQDNQYFVRSLIELAKKFGLKVVAEWVETPEDAELLREMGVDYLQGRLFGDAVIVEPWTSSGSVAEEKPVDAGNGVRLPTDVLAGEQAGPDTDSNATAFKVQNEMLEVDETAADSCSPLGLQGEPGSGDRSESVGEFQVDNPNPEAFKVVLNDEPEAVEQIVATAPDDDDPESSLAASDQVEEPFVPVVGEPEVVEAADGVVVSVDEATCGPAIPCEPDAEEDIEPFGVSLDLSRLKSAVSALDANFAAGSDKPKPAGREDAAVGKTSMAEAIKAAYGGAN